MKYAKFYKDMVKKRLCRMVENPLDVDTTTTKIEVCHT